MSSIAIIFGIFGTLSVLLLILILAKLSERFGAVVKLPPIYRYYYAASALVAVSLISQLLAARGTVISTNSFDWFAAPWFLLLFYHLPLGIGVTISFVVTWRYWSWLFTERDR